MLISGELLQGKDNSNWFNQQETTWEKHFFTLTNMGIMKFEKCDFKQTPEFIPVASLKMDVIED